MPQFTQEPQEEEEIPPFLEALAISCGNYMAKTITIQTTQQNQKERMITEFKAP